MFLLLLTFAVAVVRADAGVVSAVFQVAAFLPCPRFLAGALSCVSSLYPLTSPHVIPTAVAYATAAAAAAAVVSVCCQVRE